MSFSFNFAAIDLNDDQSITPSNENERKKDEQRSAKGKASSSGTAKQHKFDEMITSLPSKLSYTRIVVPVPQSDDTVNVYRRDLFDARFQMLHEDEEEGSEEEQKSSKAWKSVMAGAATDLVPGVYEGGLKTWECSLDLAGVLAQKVAQSSDFLQDKKVIELGCGTAVPSLYLLSKALKRKDDKPANLTLQLCDFNEQVLRMVS